MSANIDGKYFILLTCIISYSAGFFGKFAFPVKLYKGSLNPSDPDVCISQNITFTCSLLSPSESRKSIGFAAKNESTNKMFLPVSEGRVSVINETLSEFTIDIYNVSATTYVFVRCYYWEMYGDLEASTQLGETSTASVYTMPTRVEHINCIVENYRNSMNCSWNYGTIYKSNAFPDVIFRWRIPDYSASWNNCSNLNVESAYCYWDSSLTGDFTMKVIDIELTLTEPCGVNVSSDFKIDTSKIVKPNPVIGLKAYVLNSTCIRVQWRTNNSEMEYPKEHRVIVSSKWESPQVSTFNTTVDTEKDTHEMTFCDLIPYTEYMFTVRIQPTGDQAGHFSDPMQTLATTYSDKPSASPDVAEGGYSWNPRDCVGESEKRRACVFWKPIHEEDKNGPMKGLEGSFRPVTPSKVQFDENWAEDSTYGCSSGLLCNTSYVFSIKARNRNGTSETGSTMVISATTLGISQPQFIVEAANTSSVYVSWTEIDKASGYMVAWCRNKNGACETRSQINWEIFSPAKREAVIQIKPKNSPQDFLYGVSVLTEQGSSGVEWQDCVYLKGAYPKREPQNVIVSAGSEDNTLVVTWDKLACKSDEPYIAMYTVTYNKLQERNQKSQHVAASGEARVVLKDLERDQTYNVSVIGITKDGRYGPGSKPITGKPLSKRLKPGAIAGIVMVVMVVCIFAAVGCFCLIRRCKERAQRFYHEAGVITVAPYPEIEKGIEKLLPKFTEQSDDSGFDTMASDKFVDVPNQPHVAENGQIHNIDTGIHGHEVLSSNDSETKFTKTIIPPVQIADCLDPLLSEGMGTNGEQLVKRIDNLADCNEKAIAARIHSDSYVSVKFLNASFCRSETNKRTCDDDNESKKEAPDYVSHDEIIDSCPKVDNNNTDLKLTGKTGVIQKSLAFSK